MSYTDFLTGLFEDGVAVVPEFGPVDEATLAEGDKILAHYEQIQRMEFPDPVPAFHPGAGRWAAAFIFRTCQFAIYRDLGEEKLAKLENNKSPQNRPDFHYSVDLVLRFLPDVTRYAVTAAEQDPLVDLLRKMAMTWPLSSVGMPDIEVSKLGGIIDHPGLLRFYADRILAKGDKTRLQHPEVQNAVQQALGYYPQLSQDLSAVLPVLEMQDTPQ